LYRVGLRGGSSLEMITQAGCARRRRRRGRKRRAKGRNDRKGQNMLTGLQADPITGTVSGIRYDFLPSLLAPSGNVFAVFAAVSRVCSEIDKGMFERFRQDLEENAKDHSYEEVLQLVEDWFGPQTAIEEWRQWTKAHT